MKIAAFESLEFLLSKNRDDLYAVSFLESPLRGFTQSNFASDHILDMNRADGWPDEIELMQNSDLAELLGASQIQALAMDTRSSQSCEKWAQEHGLKLLVTPALLQANFENKIFFEKFLTEHELPKPAGLILKNADDAKKLPWFPAVIQKPESDGSKGTYIIQTKTELADFLLSDDAVFPLLAREFISDGLPLGVSLVIGDDRSVFSALRLQAFFPRAGRAAAYLGIQWLPSSFFSKAQKLTLNDTFKKLAEALRSAGFRGVANIDFFYKQGGVYFIECNPRLGGATPQLSYQPELLHGLDFVSEFASSLLLNNPSKDLPFIPETTYEGFNLDLEYFSDDLKEKIYTAPPIGFYELAQPASFLSTSLADFEGKSRVMFYHALNAPLTYTGQFLGFVLMHRPLVSVDVSGYHISNAGESVLTVIRKLVQSHTK